MSSVSSTRRRGSSNLLIYDNEHEHEHEHEYEHDNEHEHEHEHGLFASLTLRAALWAFKAPTALSRFRGNGGSG